MFKILQLGNTTASKTKTTPTDLAVYPLGHDRMKAQITHAVSEALTLRQVIDRYELPVKVKFADPHVHFALGDDRTRSLSTLKIVTVHEEPYFLANTIAQGNNNNNKYK